MESAARLHGFKPPALGVLDQVLEHERAWHYEGGRRDLRLDLMRGFAAFVMIVDHIGGEHSWLYPLTGGNDFFVSAAEAFVFISGAVMGIVYLHLVQTQGIVAGLMKALHRSWQLYLVTVALTLSLAGLAALLDLSWRPDVTSGETPRFVLDVITLHRTFHLTDVMMLYTFLLLGAGLVILFLYQGHPLLVLGVSWAIWALWQISPESVSLPWEIQDNVLFKLPAWQVLFVTGIVVGWQREHLEAAVNHLSRPLFVGAMAAVSLVVLALYVTQVAVMDSLQSNHLMRTLVYDKPDVAVGRLAVFVLLASFSLTVTTLFWEPIRRATGWLLLPLGQNALAAYAIHVFLVAFAVKLMLIAYGSESAPAPFSTTLQVIGVLVVWLILRVEPGISRSLKQKLPTFKPRDPVRGEIEATHTNP